MKYFIETTSIHGQRVLINIRDISLIKPTMGNETEFSQLKCDDEFKYCFIRVVGEPERVVSIDDYDTLTKRIRDSFLEDSLGQ